MKRIMFLFALVAATVLSGSAQTSMLASLSHDGTITTFENGNALMQAYEAAVDGDIISLSSGSFTLPKVINKSLTIRGVGMMLNSDNTVLSGTVDLGNTSDENEIDLTFEGVSFTGGYVNTMRGNITFIKTRIAGSGIYRFDSYGKSNLKFITSFIKIRSATGKNYFITAIGSVFTDNYFSSDLTTLVNCTLENTGWASGAVNISNCIFKSSNYSNTLSVNGVVKDCVYIGPRSSFFSENDNLITQNNNRCFPADTKVYKDDTDRYELTDENAANWLGGDGTQVGIHGGSMPFNPNPAGLRIVKFMTAPKTSADGKLSVDIQVEAD